MSLVSSGGRKGKGGAQFLFFYFTRNTCTIGTCSGSGTSTSSGSSLNTNSSRRKTRSASASSPTPTCAPLPCTAEALKSTGTGTGTCCSISSSGGKRRSAAVSSPSPCSATTLSSIALPSPSSCVLSSPHNLLPLFAQLGFSDHSLSSSRSSLHILQLLLSSGVSPAHIKRLSGRRGFKRIFTLPVCDVSARIDLLGPALVSSHPLLLELRVANLRPKVELLQNLGLPVEKMVSSERLLKVNLESLKQRLSYLRYLGLSSGCVSIALRRFPHILCANIERTMSPTIEFLEKECKVPRKTICRFVTARPWIICLSKSNLVQRVQFFKSLGLDSTCPQFYAALVELANLSSTLLLARINWLVSQGLARGDVTKLILRAPFVFSCSEVNMGGKFEYLLFESNRDIQEILHYPTALALSLERRIKPRFAVMARLQERGLLKGSRSLSVILSPSDETFKRRYVDKFQDEGAIEKLEPQNLEE